MVINGHKFIDSHISQLAKLAHNPCQVKATNLWTSFIAFVKNPLTSLDLYKIIAC
jgi:hypothetical protein